MDIAKLARLGVAKKYTPDEVFCNEGDPGYEMFILLKGKVGIYLSSVDGSLFKVAELGPGDFFGEMSLLEMMPRSATIIAIEETVVIILNQGNFADVISQEPELAFRIMKGMSSRLRQLNDELVYIKSGAADDDMEEDVFGSTEAAKAGATGAAAAQPASQTPTLTASGKKRYNMVAPPDHDQYIFEKDTPCPCCEKSFNVQMVRSSKLRVKSIDNDQRQRFEGMEPLWYMVWVCPNCYYTSFNFEFKQVTDETRKLIDKQGAEFKRDFKISFSKPRQLNEVLESYYLLLRIYESAQKPDPGKLAKVWLRLYWLYKDAEDTEMTAEAAAKALEYFKDTYYNGRRNTTPEQEQRLTILLGELSLEVGAKEEAMTFFRNSILRKGGSNAINRQAEDRYQDLKKILMSEQEQA